MTSNLLPTALRRMKEADIPLVTNSWLESHRKSVHTYRVANNVYYNHYNKLIHQAFERPTTFTIMAVNPEDMDQVYGWTCYEVINDKAILHYVYVKSIYESLGIARKLLDHATQNVSHVYHTHYAQSSELLRKYSSIFNPYLFY